MSVILNARILVIDKDWESWRETKAILQESGYRLFLVSEGQEALAILKTERIDIVLVSRNVGNFDYLELIKRIKEIYVLPIVVINDRDDSMEAVLSLEIGADDFISRPFETRELMARIKAHLRLVQEVEEKVLEDKKDDDRAAQGHKGVLHFGCWTLDRDKMLVLDENKNPVDLTLGEYKLLEALTLSGGRVLSREKLFRLTRDDAFDPYDRAIDIQVARIRKKLRNDSHSPECIKTIRGVGYMLDTEKTG